MSKRRSASSIARPCSRSSPVPASPVLEWESGREAATGYPVAVLRGRTWNEELWRQAQLVCRGHHRLVVELPVQTPGWEGFEHSHWLLEKPVRPPTSLETHRQGRFAVRPAREPDRTFLQLLYTKNLELLVPPSRAAESEQLCQAHLWRLRQMPLDDVDQLFLIIEEKATLRKAGFIQVALGEPAYLEDIHLDPRFWGSYAAQRLVREAEARLAERGVQRWTSQVSTGNPRPFRTAVKSLGFEWVANRWERLLPECNRC